MSLQSGLDEKRWSDSTECCRYLRNDQDLVVDVKTRCKWRFGEPFKGPLIPFGAMLNIIRFLHETSPDFTNLERKFYLDIPWLCVSREENLEKRYCGGRH